MSLGENSTLLVLCSPILIYFVYIITTSVINTLESLKYEYLENSSLEQQQKLIKNIIAGLPGAEEGYTLGEFNEILATYKNIGAKCIEFLFEIRNKLSPFPGAFLITLIPTMVLCFTEPKPNPMLSATCTRA